MKVSVGLFSLEKIFNIWLFNLQFFRLGSITKDAEWRRELPSPPAHQTAGQILQYPIPPLVHWILQGMKKNKFKKMFKIKKSKLNKIKKFFISYRISKTHFKIYLSFLLWILICSSRCRSWISPFIHNFLIKIKF